MSLLRLLPDPSPEVQNRHGKKADSRDGLYAYRTPPALKCLTNEKGQLGDGDIISGAAWRIWVPAQSPVSFLLAYTIMVETIIPALLMIYASVAGILF